MIVGFAVIVTLIGVAGSLVSMWLLRRRGLTGFAMGLAGTTLTLLLVVVIAIPLFEIKLGRKAPAKYAVDCIRHEDPTGRAPVVFRGYLLRGLPFYLQRPVLWYHNSAQNGGVDGGSVFEFDVVRPGTPNCLTKPQQLQDLFAGSQRVFCIASRKDFATMPRELRDLVREINEVGEWMVLSNQLSPRTGQ